MRYYLVLTMLMSSTLFATQMPKLVTSTCTLTHGPDSPFTELSIEFVIEEQAKEVDFRLHYKRSSIDEDANFAANFTGKIEIFKVLNWDFSLGFETETDFGGGTLNFNGRDSTGRYAVLKYASDATDGFGLFHCTDFEVL